MTDDLCAEANAMCADANNMCAETIGMCCKQARDNKLASRLQVLGLGNAVVMVIALQFARLAKGSLFRIYGAHRLVPPFCYCCYCRIISDFNNRKMQH